MVALQPITHTHSRVPSTASIAAGHTLASAPASSRPSSRQASVAGGSPRRPPVALRSLTRNNTSVDPVLDRDGSDGGTVLPALDLILNEEDEEDEQLSRRREQREVDDGRSPSPSLRSISNTKRRKRGRKGKGMTPSMDHVHIQTTELLASATSSLARELSRQTRSASAAMQSFPDVPPPPPVPVPVSIPTITKKPSRWKLSFGKSSGEAALSTRSDSRSTQSNSNPGSARATNVCNVILGLNPSSVSMASPSLSSPPPTSPSSVIETPPRRGRGEPQSHSPQPCRGTSPISTRSGRPAASSVSSSSASSNWRNSMTSTNTSTSAFTRFSNHSMRSVSTFATSVSASSAASSSSNWRKPAVSTCPSSSSLASSLYSNNGSQSCHNNGLPRRPPPNVKCTYFSASTPLLPELHLLTDRSSVMNGVPWELSGAPRQLHQKDMDIFGAPPPPRERKRAGRGGGKGKQPATVTGSKSALEPITERPQHQYRQDAATSTTDLASQVQGQQLGAGHGQGSNGHGQGQTGPGQEGGEAPKLGKAQINSLAKKLMLSALRR